MTVQLPIIPASGVMGIKGMTDLNCSIHSISESQDYELSQNPIDKNSFISENIFKHPNRLNVKVLVKDENLQLFKSNIKSTQFSQTLFTVTNVANEVFTNMKITNYSKDTTNSMIGAHFFTIAMEEAIMVNSLVQSYKSMKNSGNGSNSNVGTKQSKEVPTSALKSLTNWATSGQ